MPMARLHRRELMGMAVLETGKGIKGEYRGLANHLELNLVYGQLGL